MKSPGLGKSSTDVDQIALEDCRVSNFTCGAQELCIASMYDIETHYFSNRSGAPGSGLCVGYEQSVARTELMGCNVVPISQNGCVGRDRDIPNGNNSDITMTDYTTEELSRLGYICCRL